MVETPTERIRILSPQGSEGTFDIYVIGFPEEQTQERTKPVADTRESAYEISKTVPPAIWPRLIPHLVPEARVLELETFGALASEEPTEIRLPQVKRGCLNSATDFTTNALALLESIQSRSERRKVILVGYGVGGLLVKQQKATVLANRLPRYYESGSRIAKLVFVETPHHAPNLEAWEDITERLLGEAGVSITGRRAQIVADLSVIIRRLSSAFLCFVPRYDVMNLPPTSCATSMREQAEASFLTTGIGAFCLYADEPESQSRQVTSLKLRSELCPPYIHISDIGADGGPSEEVLVLHLLDFLRFLAPSRWLVHESPTTQLEETDTDLEMYDEHVDKVEFTTWFKKRCVQIIGPPNSGKTALQKLLVRNLKQRFSRLLTIDFFVQSYLASDLTPIQILQSLIHQILSQRPPLFRNILPLYLLHHESGLWPESALWKVVHKLIRWSSGWHFVVSINNFQHYSSEAKSVFAKLGDILAYSPSEYVFFSTSNKEIFNIFGGLYEKVDLTIGAARFKKQVLRTNIGALLRRQPALLPCEAEIIKATESSYESYSHVKRCVTALSSCFSLSDAVSVASAIEACPREEDDITRDRVETLSRGDAHILRWSIAVISWVMLSARPLRLGELAVAAALNFDGATSTLDNLDRRVSKGIAHDLDRYLDVLVRVEADIAHIYSTATRDFFAEKLPKELPLRDFKLLSHGDLAILCLRYLTHAISKHWDFCLAQFDSRFDKPEVGGFELEFLEYAVKHWPTHYSCYHRKLANNDREDFQKSQGEKKDSCDSKLDDSVLEFLNNDDIRLKWYRLFLSLSLSGTRGETEGQDSYSGETDAGSKEPHNGSDERDMTALEISSELGLLAVVESILTPIVSVHQPEVLDSALALAVRNGHEDIARLLVRANAPASSAFLVSASTGYDRMMLFLRVERLKMTFADKFICTLALQKSATMGDYDSVKLLVKKGLSVDQKDTEGLSTIHAIAIGGAVEILELFAPQWTDFIDIRDQREQTALILATRYEHVDFVRKICQEKADVALADRWGKTALHYAITRDLEIVKILLQHHASPIVPDRDDETPLHLACYLGLPTVVQAIVDKDSSWVNSANGYGGLSPLQVAAKYGHLAIVQILLEKKADLSYLNSDGATATELAVSAGHLNVLQLLQQYSFVGRGVDINDAEPNTAEKEGLSAEETTVYYNALLSRAVESGQLLIVIHLLEYMASFRPQIELRTRDDGETLLTIAASKGHAEIARALLPKVDVNAKNKDARGPLDLSIIRKHLDMIQLFLENGADPNTSDLIRYTPLHFAAENGLVEVVESLLEKNTSVYPKSLLKETALHLAAPFPRIVHILLAAGSDPNANDYNELTPLHRAVRCEQVDSVKELLQGHADPDETDEDGFTPLHYAIKGEESLILEEIWNSFPDLKNSAYDRHQPFLYAAELGKFDALRFMLSKAPASTVGNSNDDSGSLDASENPQNVENTLVDLDAVNRQGETLLHLATAAGKLDIVKLLIHQKARLDLTDDKGQTGLHLAAKQGYLEVLRTLLGGNSDSLNLVDNEGRTALHLAAYAGHLDIVNLLLGHELEINRPDNDGQTPLHLAAVRGHLEILETLLQKSTDSLNSADYKGVTALHLAATNGHTESYKVLLSMGADVEKKDKEGNTVLHRSASNGSLGVLKEVLMTESLEIDLKNHDGKTALHLAARSGNAEALDAILEKRPNLALQDADGKTVLLHAALQDNISVLKRLLGLPEGTSLLQVGDNNGRTPLHEAAWRGRPIFVEALLQAGASPKVQDAEGRWPIHMGADNEAVCIALLDKWCDLNVENNAGWTPLTQAVYWEVLPCIDLMLKRGADVLHRDKSGQTMLHIAMQDYNVDVLLALLKKDKSNVDVQDENGNTPLHLGVMSSSPKEDFLTALIDAEANMNLRNKLGETPLEIAIRDSPEIAVFLIEKAPGIIKGSENSNILKVAAEKHDASILGLCLDQEANNDERVWSVDDRLRAIRSAAKSNRSSTLHTHRQSISLLSKSIDPMTLSAEQAFSVIRYCFEYGLVDEVLAFKIHWGPASKIADGDNWTLSHLERQMAGQYSFGAVLGSSGAPKLELPTPSCLVIPGGWLSENAKSDVIEISGSRLTTKADYSDFVSVRADHPFPVRGEGLSYFETKVSCPDPERASEAYVAIGLVGEFVDLMNACPGWNYIYPSVGYHGDNGVVYLGGAGYEQTTTPEEASPFGAGVTVGIGINWDRDEFFFTRDGKVVATLETENIHHKLYPTVTVFFDVKCTVEVNFTGDGDHPFAYRMEGSGF